MAAAPPPDEQSTAAAAARARWAASLDIPAGRWPPHYRRPRAAGRRRDARPRPVAGSHDTLAGAARPPRPRARRSGTARALSTSNTWSQFSSNRFTTSLQSVYLQHHARRCPSVDFAFAEPRRQLEEPGFDAMFGSGLTAIHRRRNLGKGQTAKEPQSQSVGLRSGSLASRACKRLAAFAGQELLERRMLVRRLADSCDLRGRPRCAWPRFFLAASIGSAKSSTARCES